jgi:hypothetical protein
MEFLGKPIPPPLVQQLLLVEKKKYINDKMIHTSARKMLM